MTPEQARGTPAAGRVAEVAERIVALSGVLVDDFDVVELLDLLAADCVELLDVSAAGILLRRHDRDLLEVVASSNEASRLMEVFQLEHDRGPCIEAVRTGRPVIVDDLAALHARWPDFADLVERAGFTAVYALPLRLRSETIGALNLFPAGADPLSANDQRLAQALADVASIAVFQQRNAAQSVLLTEQLQTALTSRIVVEQAKGVVSEYGGLEIGEAFGVIRAHARRNGIKLSEVAADLVARRLSPAVLLEAADRQAQPPGDPT